MKPQVLSQLLQEPSIQSMGAPNPDGSRAAFLEGRRGYHLLFAFDKRVNGMFTPDGELITDEERYVFYVGREQKGDIRSLSAYLVPAALLP